MNCKSFPISLSFHKLFGLKIFAIYSTTLGVQLAHIYISFHHTYVYEFLQNGTLQHGIVAPHDI